MITASESAVPVPPVVSDPPGDARRVGVGRRLLAVLFALVGGAIVIPTAVVTVGAVFPQIPILGALASATWPNVIGPATLVVLLGTLLVVGAMLLWLRRVGAVLVAFGVVALAGSLVILGDQVIRAVGAGVPVGVDVLVDAAPAAAAPDEQLTYGTAPDGSPLRMDVYRPSPEVRIGQAGVPVVMFVHGGGWRAGETDEMAALLRWFADQGYLALAPEYTLSTPEAPTWDVAMPQIGCALVWTAAHAADLDADASRIALWGGSAGGNLAITAGYAAASGQVRPACDGEVPVIAVVAGEVPAVDPLALVDNTDPVWGASTREMVTQYIGGTVEEFPERLAAVRAETYVSAAAPPTLLLASEHDHLVPTAATRRFVEQATAAGVDIEAVYRPWGDHTISLSRLPQLTLAHQLRTFFAAHGV